jgi:hypothetical protein
MLASYSDYRIRGPDLLLFRASLEHSLGKLPIGAFFFVDEGKIGPRRDDISLDHLRHSFNVGLTVRAGGLPVVYFLFALGRQRGHSHHRHYQSYSSGRLGEAIALLASDRRLTIQSAS